MTFKTIRTEDRILFFLSETEALELTSHDKIKRLVEASDSNLDQLIDYLHNINLNRIHLIFVYD